MKIKNQKGISTIIATLILVLLTIVLVGIVWAVVSGIVKTSTQSTQTQAQCLNSAIEITVASCQKAGNGNCNVTLERTLGTDTIGGMRLIFINSTGASNFTDISGDLAALVPKTVSFTSMVGSASEVDAAIYFTDSSGNKNLCTPFQFTGITLA
ncbi:MAG TPA: archaellin/type IV pilin N-terminal domain-containing protein [Candidatus Omnitrophota bacterium]|nr:archaellin/type IV pilin N-terminal domain-containing protein [Candidatus Omnitrophota bacterium]